MTSHHQKRPLMNSVGPVQVTGTYLFIYPTHRPHMYAVFPRVRL